jgi:hypothetical protein
MDRKGQRSGEDIPGYFSAISELKRRSPYNSRCMLIQVDDNGSGF